MAHRAARAFSGAEMLGSCRHSETMASRNKHLPSLSSRMTELSANAFFGARQLTRWAVVDPHSASLTLWEKLPEAKPPRTSVSSGSSVGSRGSWRSLGLLGRKEEEPGRKVHSLDRLVAVESNPHFRNIMLRFSDQQQLVCLTAPQEADFQQWMALLRQYV